MPSTPLRFESPGIGHDSMLAVFNAVHRHAPISRLRIAARSGLSAAAVSRISRRLVDIGLIEEDQPRPSSRPGRREVDLRVRGAGVLVGGISINAFEQWVAVANLRGEILARRRFSPRHLGDAEGTIDDAARAMKVLLRGGAGGSGRLLGIGMANAGVIDPGGGVVVSAPTLGWSNVSAAARLERHLGLPVVIEGIANALATAEHQFGVAKSHDNLILLNATLGIGCALIADGRLLRGHAYRAGLIGQLRIGRPGARPVETLDDVAGGGALALQARLGEVRRTGAKPHDARLLTRLIEQTERGDKAAIDTCCKGANALATWAAQLTTALAAELVLLAGPLAGVPAYRTAFAERLPQLIAEGGLQPRVMVAEKTVIESACLLAIRDLVSIRGLHLRREIEPAGRRA